MQQQRVILYFGSFNPIHTAHTALCSYVLGRGLCDRVWIVVSPHNPHKSSSQLAAESDRLAMARIAVESMGESRVEVSDVEFDLPRPSYTVNTLDALTALHRDMHFSMLVGDDIVENIDRWKESERLLKMIEVYVYPRTGRKVDSRFSLLTDAPLFDISSTEVRERVAGHQPLTGLVCGGVERYIVERGLYL